MSKATKNILKLATSGKSVFSINELAVVWKVENKNILRVTVNRFIKNGYLIKIRRGIYALDNREVNVFELANKLKKFSYVSFETVLAKEGIIFQWQNIIYSASNRSSKTKNKYGNFHYQKLPDRILFNNDGIINKQKYFIAVKERAFCDKIYKDGIGYFDNLGALNRNKVYRIAKFYNKRVEREVRELLK